MSADCFPGLIHRQYKPVYWSPSSGTALAEAELEYDDNHVSTAAFIRYPIINWPSKLSGEGGTSSTIGAVIWTTTPWTLPANRAIAVHDDLDYVVVQFPGKLGQLLLGSTRLQPFLKHLCLNDDDVHIVKSLRGADITRAGLQAFNFFQNKPSPILHADFVSDMSGSGLVHMAPGHGMDDYNVCQRQGIPIFAPVDDRGRFTSAAHGDTPDGSVAQLQGKDVLHNGSAAVIEYLRKQDHKQPAVLATHKYTHKHPTDWRTKQPVIVRATEQWFADVEGIKESALRSLDEVNFVPQSGRLRLESFIKGRSQWCVSRQRAWGVPIPALYRVTEDGTEAVMTGGTIDHIISIIQGRGIDAWWTDSEDEKAWVPPDFPPGKYRRGKDTMDVWFDSGTSWTSLEARTADSHLADVYIEGTDQHRGWFQSSILTHIASQDTSIPKAPFKNLITHGFTLDQEGRKMSKSLGNVVSPDQIMDGTLLPPVENKRKKKQQVVAGQPKHDALGPDALRLWVASSDYTKDVIVGQLVLQSVNSALHKYRVTFKWLLGVLHDYDPSSVVQESETTTRTLADWIVLYKLELVEETVYKAYSGYEFHKAIGAINNFVNLDLSAFYLETVKDLIYTGDKATRSEAQAICSTILYALLSMLKPVTPLLCEEVWAHLPRTIRGGYDRIANATRRIRLKEELGTSESITDNVPLSAHPWLPKRAANAPSAKAERQENANYRRITEQLFALRGTIQALQEEARSQKLIGSSLEVDVILGLPAQPPAAPFDLSPENLANFFVVSRVHVLETTEGQHADEVAQWTLRRTVKLQWTPDRAEEDCTVAIRPAEACKCPRCWRYVAPKVDVLCGRCEQVVREQGGPD